MTTKNLSRLADFKAGRGVYRADAKPCNPRAHIRQIADGAESLLEMPDSGLATWLAKDAANRAGALNDIDQAIAVLAQCRQAIERKRGR